MSTQDRSRRRAGRTLAVGLGLSLAVVLAAVAYFLVRQSSQLRSDSTPQTTTQTTAGRRTSAGSAEVSIGVGSTPAGPNAVVTVRTYHVQSQGRQRTFLLVAPNPMPSGALPLVLVYHGAYDTASNTMHETDLDVLASKREALVAYLQGYNNSWNEGAGHTPAERAGINDVTFTRAVLRRIESGYRVRTSEVAATGLSNGALMVEDLGCRLGVAISLIVPVEGPLPVRVSRTCRPARPVSVFEIHGTADNAIPYHGGRFYGDGGGTTVLSAPASAARWSVLDGCAGHPTRTRRAGSVETVYSDCLGGAEVTLDTIEGGTHRWLPAIGLLIGREMARLPGG